MSRAAATSKRTLSHDRSTEATSRRTADKPHKAFRSLQSESDYQKQWCASLKLPEHLDLSESSLWELQQYFPQRPAVEIKDTFDRSKALFAEHWHRKDVDTASEEAIVDFYNSTDLEIFELMKWHASVEAGESLAPLNYFAALEIAAHNGLMDYLDFGSGVGSAGILLARRGLNVTLADVSDPLLSFVRFRMRLRGLQANYIDLKVEQLPREHFDILTCFDVIEHVREPLETLRLLRDGLRTGGYLVLNIPYEEDEDHPMHIMHDGDLWRRFRGLGFTVRADLSDAWKGVRRTSSLWILQKVERSPSMNRLVGFYDTHVPGIRTQLKISRILRSWAT